MKVTIEVSTISGGSGRCAEVVLILNDDEEVQAMEIPPMAPASPEALREMRQVVSLLSWYLAEKVKGEK